MVLLVDASVYVFRAYFSIPHTMTDPSGQPVNAVYGFARFLGDLLERASPGHAGVAFDESLTTSFRNDIYPLYKANRETPPPELEHQFARCRELTRGLGLTAYAHDSFEADDIIGAWAAAARREGRRAVIVTRDKDLAQLLRPGDEYWDYARDRRYGYDDIAGVFGVAPERIADLLALTGDSVDNIPGVPGIGPKTAVALLRHFDGLDALYEDLDRVSAVPVRGAARLAAKLAAHRDAAFLSRRLAQIVTDLPGAGDLDGLRRRPPDLAALEAFYDEAGMGRAVREQAERIHGQLVDA